MITNDTLSAGSAGNAGSTQLGRLNPREIAVLVLPGTNVQVMSATDEQFQQLVDASGLKIDANGIAEWSFDDRIRFINYARRRGIDLFASPNKNNSEPEQKQFGNNSPTELFEGAEVALEAGALSIDASMEKRVQSVRESTQNSSETEEKRVRR